MNRRFLEVCLGRAAQQVPRHQRAHDYVCGRCALAFCLRLSPSLQLQLCFQLQLQLIIFVLFFRLSLCWARLGIFWPSIFIPIRGRPKYKICGQIDSTVSYNSSTVTDLGINATMSGQCQVHPGLLSLALSALLELKANKACSICAAGSPCLPSYRFPSSLVALS